ncbi:TetR family transcriptional regulator [Kitasatospora indigofera]|uniref:TetR family transcriptional regulator n=1 Tax=Kitasatospora indigofera TaxID=67307 RepID=UPI003696AC62
MARPPRYDETQFLDAAVRLAAAAGPAAVTMTAVAKEVGAPSGSVYHRFPQRPALLAELWLRTVERFQAGWLAALAAPGDPVAAAAAAARHVVAWSRLNPQEAAVLLYGPDDYGRADWPAGAAERAARGTAQVRAALAGLTGRLGGVEPEAVTLALVDLPLAVVRRHLRAGGPLPPGAERLAGLAATRLLAPGADAGA